VARTSPTTPRSTRAPADVLGPDVDLGVGRRRLQGKELAVGEVGGQHQERVAVAHRVARREADQASHADVERVVPFDVLLAAHGVDHRRPQGFAEGDQLVVRAGCRIAQHRHALAR
jgi:hypothetical protein